MRLPLLSIARPQFLANPKSPRLRALGLLLLPLLATLLWAMSLRHVDISQMNDFGLVSVLPLPLLVAPVVLIVSYCLALRQPRLAQPILLLHIVILIVMLYGITTLVEEQPRLHVAYRHVGVTDYIMRNGRVNPLIDAYFNWPGFFILSAFVTQIGGLGSPLALLPWASVFFNLLYLGPVFMILNVGTSDKRQVWLALLLYFLTNWISQDYFAPQALNYFFYLVIVAILLRWFQEPAGEPLWLWRYLPSTGPLARVERWLGAVFAPPDLPGAASGPGQRAGLIGIIAAMGFVIAASHQATSLIVVLSVAALVLFRRCSARGLPILLALLVLAWISFMATAYMSRSFQGVAQSVGNIDQNVGQNLTNRIGGNLEHLFVVRLRLVMSLAIGVLGGLGALRRMRRGHWTWTSYALLAVAPYCAIALQAYGGEILLRSYLFALPMMVFFAAALFYPSRSAGRSLATTAATMLVCVGLLAGFFFTRYGNERMDYYTPDEFEAVQYVYSVAPPGSRLLSVTTNVPWKFQGYEQYRYASLRWPFQTGDVNAWYSIMRSRNYPASYLILTRSQKACLELYFNFPGEDWDRVERALLESPRFKVIYANDHATILTLSEGGERRGV